MLQCNFLYNKRLPNIITVLYSGQPEGHTGGLRDTGSYKGKWRTKIGVLNLFSRTDSGRHKKNRAKVTYLDEKLSLSFQ